MFFDSGPPDLTKAPPWNAKAQCDRNMPDVTDVGPRQIRHPTQSQSGRTQLLIKNEIEQALMNKSTISPDKLRSKDTRKELIVKEEDLPVVPKPDSQEEEVCDDLIHLHGPCTEVSIINALRVRFTKRILQVSCYKRQ